MCCNEGTQLLDAFFSAPAGAFKRVATLVVVARTMPFFTFIPTPPLQDRQRLLSEALVLLVPVALRMLRVNKFTPPKDDAWESLDQWQGFSSFHAESHFRALIEWLASSPREDLGRMILAISLIIEEAYLRGALVSKNDHSERESGSSQRVLIPPRKSNISSAHKTSKANTRRSALKTTLTDIPTGPKHASAYHKEIFRLLSLIFEDALTNGVIEEEINSGRKRIDIVFENSAENGFFHRLVHHHRIFCPYVFFECKNYKHDVSNPEFDQLIGRFHDKRGRFGVLVCRKIAYRQKTLDTSRDVVNANQGCILVFDDEDMLALVELRNTQSLSDVNNYLSQKLRAILM